MTEIQAPPTRPPTHEALLPTDLFQNGIGNVIVARFKSAGQRVEVGIFLVDVFCLGIKRATFEVCELPEYLKTIREHYESRFPMVAVEPCCARKLVEKAVAYAEGLGFAPHPDCKKASRVFGGIRADECGKDVAFGREGKPFYFRGPNETEAQARRIVEQLARSRGEGNFDYLVELGDSCGHMDAVFG